MAFQRLIQFAKAPLARPHRELRKAAFGYILRDPADPHHMARRVGDRKSDVQNPPHLPVRSNDAVLVPHAFAREQPRHARHGNLAILWMEELGPTLEIGDDTLTRPTPNALKGRTEVFEMACRSVGDPERVLRRLTELTESLLTGCQCRLSTSSLYRSPRPLGHRYSEGSIVFSPSTRLGMVNIEHGDEATGLHQRHG